MGDTRSGAAKDRSAEEIKEMWTLRSQGYTLQMIADKYNCSPQNVSQRLKTYRDSLPRESFEEYVAQSLERLEEMRRALQDGIDSGNARSIEVAIQLETKIAKLLGLDKPDKVELEVIDNTPEWLKDMAARRKKASDDIS